MHSITIARELAAPPDEVRELVQDVEPFMRAAGFSTVEVDGVALTIGKGFAVAKLELDLRLLEEPDTVLAYEQVDGIFEDMYTGYVLEETAEGCRISATTDFELDVAAVGAILDATVIRRQRTKELESQFDYLEAEVTSSSS
jgi:ribosome-associated toxin RatA of RatAB toxin-antitoxin module